MKQMREELRGELRQKADKLIEEALDWYEKSQMPTMSDIEEETLRIRKSFSEKIAQVLVQGQGSVHPKEEQICSKCLQVMKYKGKKKKTIDSLIGEVRVERAYYHCPTCKGGNFPPRPTTGLMG